MTIYNKYKIQNKTVSLETYLLYNYLNDKHFIEKFNENNWTYFDKENIYIPDKIKQKVNIILIPMESNEGITLISKMRKKTLESTKYINDIWTKDKILVWYLDYKMKDYLLGFRTKNIKTTFYQKNVEKKYNFTKNQLDKLDIHSKLFYNYLTNKSFHLKLEKDSSYIKKYNSKFTKTNYPSNIKMSGYICKPNTLYLILPPRNKLKEIIENPIVDILYNNIGNITLLWSSKLENVVKDSRIKSK